MQLGLPDYYVENFTQPSCYRLQAQGAKPALGNMVLPDATPAQRRSLVNVDSPAGRELAAARKGLKLPDILDTGTPPAAPQPAPWMVCACWLYPSCCIHKDSSLTTSHYLVDHACTPQ